MNDIDEDTSAWLGCPTPLEMYQHQCALLEDELIQTEAMLRKARANIAGLVQMNDLLATGKATADASLKKALSQVAELNLDNSQLNEKIRSLHLVAEQRDHLFRENQRLLLEKKLSLAPIKSESDEHAATRCNPQ
ncbi:hypothetical protein [Pseudomonas sp. QC2]|uniref:hypothetical protein n=1 Tax=Pseudomonas sp. QC2 TaxID=2065822 RepID=UPI002114F2C4|nr:hypothetical protein [Pseudomonas sp. QC2]